MLVKFLADKSLVKAGEIVELADETAENYLAKGIVELVVEKKTKNTENSKGDK